MKYKNFFATYEKLANKFRTKFPTHKICWYSRTFFLLGRKKMVYPFFLLPMKKMTN